MNRVSFSNAQEYSKICDNKKVFNILRIILLDELFPYNRTERKIRIEGAIAKEFSLIICY